MLPDFRTAGRVTAVLGPTNTGKTHHALNRLMSHPSGVVGFPLRLLARENYDKVVRLKGADQVALLTGEEKIVPPRARYFLCTVESMPVGPGDRFSFVAVDEIQLCADPDRGHVFTHRLLHARGVRETMFLGAETIAPLLRRLVPDAELETRPRLSTLTHTGYRNLSRLPPRTAVVAFSAADVYAVAELLRRQKGGAAVVLGALSPRTRNAQVALYQAGEVDYLVATDAIGMGLNMDVAHVAFAALTKFDGRQVRVLSPSELAQIAGRAGRHRSDGTFGVTADAPPLPPHTVDRLEAHRFEPLQRLYWRNTPVRFSSIDTLLGDLRKAPPSSVLVRPPAADDERALEFLAGDPEIAELARGPEGVRLLWEVCQIPDFRKLPTDAHPRLLGELFRHLRSGDGLLPETWVGRQVERLDRTEGDIDQLTQRLAAVRTWTYVSHRSWLADGPHWQEKTRALEDRLSDALHLQLTLRFVDRRTAALSRRLRDHAGLAASVTPSGEVLVEGQLFGRVAGFHYVPEGLPPRQGAQQLQTALERALRREFARRAEAFAAVDDEQLSLAGDGTIHWNGAPVARLKAGPEAVRPRLDELPFPLLSPTERKTVQERVSRWFEGQRRRRLAPLLAPDGDALTGPARGLLFQLSQGLGFLPRAGVAAQLDGLTRDDRRRLRRRGIVVGRASVFVPGFFDDTGFRATLWAVFHGVGGTRPNPPPGVLVFDRDAQTPPAYWEALGFRTCGPVAVRVDALEEMAARAWDATAPGCGNQPLAPAALLPAPVPPTPPQAASILRALGYTAAFVDDGGETKLQVRRKPKRRGPA